MSTNTSPTQPSPPTSPATDFPLFPLLPLELQRKIWRCTFPCSRTVSLSYNITPPEAALSPPPPTLHICAESRAETLLHYTLIYRSSFVPSHGISRGDVCSKQSKAMRQPICLNPSTDTIAINARDLCGAEKHRRRFTTWLRFLNAAEKEKGILERATHILLTGLDWDNTMYMHLRYQPGLRCKDPDAVYEGQGGVGKWEELNYGALLRFGGLRAVACAYAHVEYLGNFEEQLEGFLALHGEVWGGRPPVVGRVV